MRRYLEATDRGHLWKSGPNPRPYWDFYKDWNWTGEEFVKFCNEGADAGVIFAGDAREYATEAVQLVKSLGHTVIIITDRSFGSTPKVSQEITHAWLAQHNIPHDELYFSANKNVVPTDMFVEDKVENFVALDSAGVETYLITREWNRDFETSRRIDSVMEYANIVKQRTLNPNSQKVSWKEVGSTGDKVSID